MNILHIWKGDREISRDRISTIEQVHELYPDANFLLLTNGNPLLPYQKIINWEEEKERMIKFYNLSFFPTQWNEYMAFSDWYRFYYLINNPNTLFLDTDCRMLKHFDFEKEDKIIYTYNEICLLYSPSNNSFGNLKKILDRYIELKLYGLLVSLSLHIENQSFTKNLDNSYFKHE